MSFIGIEPAIKPASLQSVTKKIGVLATRSTLASDLFAKTSEHLKQEEQVEIIEQVGEGLVDLIEAGRIESPKMTQLLRRHLLPMVALGIDYLVLGCTHYPYHRPSSATFPRAAGARCSGRSARCAGRRPAGARSGFAGAA